jgi:hypothetical protein
MAMYRGAPLIEQSARLLKDEAVAFRIAVVGQHHRARRIAGRQRSVRALCHTGRIGAIEIDPYEAMDIDTVADLERAQARHIDDLQDGFQWPR